MNLDVALEDGELPDDCDTYTPLERPANYSASTDRFPKPVESESEGELQTTSASDSDSDTQVYQVKRPKIKPRLRPVKSANRKKKYDVWSTRVHEDLLSETLISCDVTKRDRSRDVESYDYTLSENYRGDDKVIRTSNKRSNRDRKNANLRPMKRRSSDDDDIKGESRILLELVADECEDADFAKDVANKLYEEKEDLIVRIVSILGQEKIRKIYNEVKRIEADGGMLIMNKSRRRTPGGVFLFLVKHDDDLTKEQQEIIFEDEKKNYKEVVKAKKKQRIKIMKAKQAASKQSSNLPELLTRAELVSKLGKESWSPKEDAQEDVTNPPPTPETDCHVDSGDGMEGNEPPLDPRKIQKYSEDDFLDVHAENDMDFF